MERWRGWRGQRTGRRARRCAFRRIARGLELEKVYSPVYALNKKRGITLPASILSQVWYDVPFMTSLADLSALLHEEKCSFFTLVCCVLCEVGSCCLWLL